MCVPRCWTHVGDRIVKHKHAARLLFSSIISSPYLVSLFLLAFLNLKLVARAGVLRRLTLHARPDPRPVITLRIESASELRRGWLGRES